MDASTSVWATHLQGIEACSRRTHGATERLRLPSGRCCFPMSSCTNN